MEAKKVIRNKLIEILDCLHHEFGVGEVMYFTDTECEIIADHLMQHGVTVQDLTKPLSYEEARDNMTDPMWIEFRNDPASKHNGWTIKDSDGYFIIRTFGIVSLKASSYGRLWRCWPSEPTVFDIAEAKWEEK